MLKRISIRKIAVTTSALFIITLFSIFPTKPEVIELKQNIVYEEEHINAKVFLIDEDNYVSLVGVNLSGKSVEEKMKNAVEMLIINKNKKLPKNFKAVIPSGTKILTLSVEGDVVTIDFSDKIRNVKEEDKMIEAIVYSLTEFNNITGVKILVNGKDYSSKYSGILNRNIGINKEYDINNLRNISYTTIYYINKVGDVKYYTPVTKVSNDSREKIAVIIEELKSSLVYQSNLSSFLNSNAELKDYEIKESVMHLTFNDKIFDDFNSKNILEEVKYTIGKSIKDNYDVNEVVFYVEGEEITKTVLKSLEN